MYIYIRLGLLGFFVLDSWQGKRSIAMRVSVCPLAYLRNTCPKFTKFLCLSCAVAWSCSGGFAICYVFPIFLLMTPCLPIIAEAKATNVGHLFKVLAKYILFYLNVVYSCGNSSPLLASDWAFAFAFINYARWFVITGTPTKSGISLLLGHICGYNLAWLSPR